MGVTQEAKSVTILALGFGLVGIDRFLISTMFPVIAKDLQLGYSDIGIITGALAIAWGMAALFMGNLSDRIGRRSVLVGSLIVFSLLIGASGLAAGLAGLVMVRVIMGLADGAFTPASISATMEASAPSRHGRNIGIQQMMLPLFGLGLAPLLVGAMLHVIDWRWIFALFAIPGLLIAWGTARIIPSEPVQRNGPQQTLLADWKAVLSYSNIRVQMLLMLCWLTCLVTTSAFLPSYLVDHLKLDFGQMGAVMSAIGFGATAGTLLLPWLSDKIGRKPVMILSAVGSCAMLILLSMTGAQVSLLFAALFMVNFFNFAALTLTVGPLCSETVPAHLIATASGVVIAVGELFGGGLAPIVAGVFAERFGINHLLWLPIIGNGCAILLCMLLQETHSTVQEQQKSTV